MSFTTALRPYTPAPRSVAPQPIVLTLNTSPSTPATNAAQTLQGLTFPITLTVETSTPNPAQNSTPQSFTVTLKLPDGRTVEAQSPLPLTKGLPLQIPAAPALTGNTQAAPILLRALPTPIPNAAQTQAATPNAPTLPPTATPQINAASSQNTPIITLQNLTPSPPAVVVYTPQQAVAGPIPLQTSTPLPPAWQNQHLTLTLRTPTQGTLQSATANIPQKINITLPSSLNLPLKQDISIVIPKIIPNTQNSSLTALVLPQTEAQNTPSPSPTLRPPQTGLLNTLRLLLPNTETTPPPLGTSTARILPQPVPTSTPHVQPLLLANGVVAQIELPTPPTPPQNQPLPTPLPAGSVLVVNIPTLTGPAAIVQLHTNQPQLLPQTGSTAAVGTPITPQAVLPAGSILNGTIIGQNANGQPLISIPSTTQQTPPQTFALTLTPSTNPNNNNPSPLTSLVVGAKVQLQIGPEGTAQLLAVTLPEAAAKAMTLSTLGSQWAALSGALGALQAQNPALAAQARRQLPQLANLLPGLMRLLEALPQADTATVLGQEAARTAQALGHTLDADLAQLATLTQRPEDGSWRSVVFPYYENPDGQPKQGGFFWRREAEDDPRGSSNARFVAELELTGLGPMQLDGLLSYPALWLKLRSHTPLENADAQGLTDLVTNLLDQFGLEGGISLETTTTFPINPAQEIRARAEEALSMAIE